MKENSYICLFNVNGFKWIVNASAWEKEKVFKYLKGETKVDPVIPRDVILNIRNCSKTFPEVWAFESEIPHERLAEIAIEQPAVLIDAIREGGRNLFKTKEVSK